MPEEFEWRSDDETIATVDASGLVTGVSEGKVWINAVSKESDLEAHCLVSVGVVASGDAGDLVWRLNEAGVLTLSGYGKMSQAKKTNPWWEHREKITKAVIEKDVIYVDDWAFMDCRSLVSIEVDPENRRYCSMDGVLFNKDRWELVRFPQGKVGAYTIPEGVLSIHFVAFMDCVGLTEINFSSTVDAIVAEAFMGCTGLTTLVLPRNIRGIGAWAFEDCTGLVSVTLPANDTVSLGHKTFVGCTNL